MKLMCSIFLLCLIARIHSFLACQKSKAKKFGIPKTVVLRVLALLVAR